MKLHLIVFVVSSSLLLTTVTAIPGLRIFRSSLDNVNRYRIRDTVPADSEKNRDDVNVVPPPSDLDSATANSVQTPANRIKRPMDAAAQVLKRGMLRRNGPAAEELPAANPVPLSPAPSFTNDAPSSIEYGNIPSKQTPINDAQTTLPAAVPADVDPSALQPYPDLNRPNDNLAPNYSEPSEPLSSDEDLDQQKQVSPTALSRLRQFASVTSILAKIARIPQAVAIQIDSVIGGLQNTYPTNTNVGAYIMGTRFLLRNQMALKPFDLMDRAGLGRVDELVSSMPSIFNPMFSSLEQYMSEFYRRMSAILRRMAESARRVSERARNSISGMNLARNNDSYSLSIPNVIDMVLKGRLASALDEYLAFLQRGLVSGLSRIGNTFSNSAPVPVSNPVQNQGYQLRNSMPQYSALPDDYYYRRPTRYYD